jgi:hypothetical protein
VHVFFVGRRRRLCGEVESFTPPPQRSVNDVVGRCAVRRWLADRR